MSTNQKDKPSKRQKFIQGFRSMFKFPKSRNSSPARNALPNPSSSVLGSMQTAPTSAPSLATGNEVPSECYFHHISLLWAWIHFKGTTARDTSSFLPANEVADTGDDTGTRITVEVPINTAQPTVSLIHTSSTVMDPLVTPLIPGSHASSAHMTTFQPEALLTSINVGADRGGNASAAVSQVSHTSGILMRDGLQLAWNGLQLLLEKAEKSLVGTPFQVPVGIINTLIELKNAVSDNNDELDAQISRTKERLDIIKDVTDKNTGSDELMRDFAKKLADKLSDLDKMAEQATWKKILENEQNKSKIDGIFKYIDEQTKDFQMRLALKIDQNTKHLHQSLHQMLLDNWPCSDRAMYDTNSDDVQISSRGLCTPNTRVAILEQIHHWAQDFSLNSPQVFWLTGHAGSGKSTIAYTIAHDFDEGNGVLKTMQASFFCSRQFENTRQLKHIIPTLVYQLACHSQIFANSLLAADKNFVHKQLSKQMQGLLIDPWKQFMQNFSSDLPPYLIIIDALDEIEGKAGAEFLKELLMTIKNGHLQGLKFLVTSRPDPELAGLCNSFPPDSVCYLQDVSQEQSNDDIMTYLHSKLSVFQSTSELEELKEKANGLFIYASTAVKYISLGATSGEQHELMRQLLNPPKIMKSSEFLDISGATAPIDALYHQILSEAFQVPEYLIQARLNILHNILCAEERISTSIAAGLLSNATDVKDMKERADDLVKKLHAVLYVKDDKVFCGAQLQEINGHTNQVTSVAFSPDGKSIVSGSFDQSVRVWEASSGAQLKKLNGHTDQVTSVAFSPDGKYIVSGSEDQSVRVWDVSSGAQLQKLNGHAGWVTSVAFSPDGKSIVSGSFDQSVRMWDALSGEQLQKLNGHTNWVTSAAFSPDGKSIVSGSFDQSVRVWDASSGAQLQELNSHTNQVTSVAFSPDGKSIVSGSFDQSVRVWDASSGAQLQESNGHINQVTSVSFSPDGKSIVSGSFDQFVRVWDASSGAQLQELNGHTDQVTSVAFSPDGKSIVSGSFDQSVRVWDASSGEQLQEFNGHTNQVTSVAFSPDGKSIVSGSFDQSVRMWDASSGAQLQKLNGHAGWVTSVAFSPDGKSIASGSFDQSIRVWDASSGAQLQELSGHTNQVTSVAFSPDGRSIVSGSGDQSVRVWNASSDAQLLELDGHTNQVTSVAFSPIGKSIISGSFDQCVSMWEASSSAQLQELNGHAGWVTSVAFSPDGKYIVSGSEDQSVRVWDASSGAQLQELNGHTNQVTSVAFSPDGKSIVSGSGDQSVRVWDACSGPQLQELNGHTNCVTSVTFSSDAKSIVPTSHNSTLKVYLLSHII
ncbi:hypothetical protein E4T56_gene10766 [Termitomyces sp. T112]|nr:hypothetical protein E4T56_gene10766 [Termitomyces sp. T112]